MSKNHVRSAVRLGMTLSGLALLAVAVPAAAQTQPIPKITAVTVPASVGWYAGETAIYTQLDASDQNFAKVLHANYAPFLGNAANGKGVDDFYVFTNVVQGNVLPSSPRPAGPHSRGQAYTPIWQVSEIAWNAGTTPFVLTSEKAILRAIAEGLVTRTRTNVIVNCSVVFTPTGGLLPGATLISK